MLNTITIMIERRTDVNLFCGFFILPCYPKKVEDDS